jgi:PAS domain S-box-containing protein
MKSDLNVQQLPREFREQLRLREAMLDHAHVIVRDLEGRIVYWSATDAEIYGWSAEEALGAVSFELLHTEIPEPRETLERMADVNGRWEGEIVNFGRDGRRHIAMTTWTAHRNEEGEPVAFIEVNCDISKQKAAERELRARERDFRAFFHLNGVGNVIADAVTGRFLTVNQTFCDLTGYSAEELSRLSSFDITHPEDRARDAIGWRESQARHEAHYTIEKRYVRRDGRTIWVSVTSTMIGDETGEPLYAVGVIIDVTSRHEALKEIGNARADLERRVAERTAALGVANAELDQMSKKFKTLIDASPAAVIALDRADHIEIWNPEAEVLFGLTSREVHGRHLLDLPLSWESPETLANLLATTGNRHASVRLHALRDRTLDLSIWIAAYPDGDGDAGGHVLLLLDETEKLFLEHAMLQAGEREQRRIGQELHDHLAQQLLGAAFGTQALFKELQRSGSPTADQAGDIARLINDSVQDARDLARGINPIEIDSAGLMSALQELAERTRAGAHIELRCDPPVLVSSPDVALHIFRIAQEAVNNALRHARATRILIDLSENHGLATLRVSDNGAASSEETAPDAVVGIGIMKYRAQAIRGELSVETIEGTGTTITCTFPNPS